MDTSSWVDTSLDLNPSSERPLPLETQVHQIFVLEMLLCYFPVFLLEFSYTEKAFQSVIICFRRRNQVEMAT